MFFISIEISYTYFVYGNESMSYGSFVQRESSKRLGLDVVLRTIYESKHRGDMKKKNMRLLLTSMKSTNYMRKIEMLFKRPLQSVITSKTACRFVGLEPYLLHV